MRKGRRNSDFENINKELTGIKREEEEIKSPKCGRKGNVENVNEETKEISSEGGDIGIHKCRRIIRVDTMNEEVKGWKSSSKQQENPPEIKVTNRRFA